MVIGKFKRHSRNVNNICCVRDRFEFMEKIISLQFNHKCKSNIIKDKDGQILFYNGEICNLRSNDLEELYNDEILADRNVLEAIEVNNENRWVYRFRKS